MTNAQLITLLRKPGKVTMPVINKHGVTYIFIEKSYLIASLLQLDKDALADWTVYHAGNGITTLDVQD